MSRAMRQHPRHPSEPGAFTLVELLVVVTIIVILLALLTPALDRAIYQAELAVCAAQQHAIVGGLQTYAMGAQRSYPYRPGHRGGSGGTYSPQRLRTGPGRDNRLDFLPAFDLNLLNCPLTGELDWSDFDEPEPIVPSIYSPYHLWAGIQYSHNAIGKGMFRLGDAFTYTEAGGPEHRFNALVSDRDLHEDGGRVQGTHPDDAGVLHNTVLQNEVHPFNGIAADPYIYSQWENNTTYQRGLIDANVGAADGAVTRYTHVGIDDERFVPVPDLVNGGRWRSWRTYLPN